MKNSSSPYKRLLKSAQSSARKLAKAVAEGTAAKEFDLDAESRNQTADRLAAATKIHQFTREQREILLGCFAQVDRGLSYLEALRFKGKFGA
jgi:hypothetical protein